MQKNRSLSRLIILLLVIALGYLIWEAIKSSSAIEQIEVIPVESQNES